MKTISAWFSAPLFALLVLATSGCPNGNPTTCEFDSDCGNNLMRCCSGTCADITADVDNCGACGAVCPSERGTASCVARVCKIECEAGRGNCDNVLTNGCEAELNTDEKNCGACGTACFADNAAGVCSNGACGKGACNEGYADCDAIASNGCEVSVQDDEDNCGVCGRVCTIDNATARCFGGSCGVGTCETGYGNCDADPKNGCEANLLADAEHCGDCAVACESGEQCLGGTCRKLGLIIYGGATSLDTGDPVDDLVRFDPAAKAFEEISAVAGTSGKPQGRAYHLAVWDGAASRMLVYGGITTTSLDPAVWELDFKQDPPVWNKLPDSAESPGPRAEACYAFDREHRTLYFFGGQDDQGIDRTDFWKLDVASGAWTRIHDDLTGPDDPPAILGSSCAYDAEHSTIVMFGGIDFDTSTTTDALWTWDTTAQAPAWTRVSATNTPAPRTNAVFFDGESPPTLFAGAYADGFSVTGFNDVQQLDLTAAPPAWSPESADGAPGAPPARLYHAGAFASGHRYVYGGVEASSAALLDDLWEYDPETKQWTELSPVGAESAPAGKFLGTVVVPE